MNRLHFILVVESYMIRKGLVSILNHIPGAVVVRESGSLLPLVPLLSHDEFDFLIISETLLEQATDVYVSNSQLLEKTILLTDHFPEKKHGEIQQSLRVSDSREEIHRKIRELMDSHSGSTGRQDPSELTEREKTIVRLVSMGLTNKQIADKLFLSTHTVITHRKNISSKLGIKSVSGLTVYAIVNNIITLEEVAASNPK